MHAVVIWRWHGHTKALSPSVFTCANRCSQPKLNTGTARVRKQIDKPNWNIAMRLPYLSSHWIGKSRSALRPWYRHRGGRLFTVRVESRFFKRCILHDPTTRKIRAGRDLRHNVRWVGLAPGYIYPVVRLSFFCAYDFLSRHRSAEI